MSYVCLEELFALVGAHDETNEAPSIVVLPPTPRFPKKMTHPDPQHPSTPTLDDRGTAAETEAETEAETVHALYVRLARTAAPYLILTLCLVDPHVHRRPPAPRPHAPATLTEERAQPDPPLSRRSQVGTGSHSRHRQCGQ